MRTTMTKTLRTILLGAVCVTPLVLQSRVGSASDEMCTAPHALDKYKMLRRLSLDLRNRVPSFEEYEALANVETVPNEVIDGYLASDDYRLAMRRHHENQLWPNLGAVRFSGVATTLSPDGTDILRVSGRSNTLRGSRDTACEDVEHTAFDPAFPGEFRPIQRKVGGERIEGYRMVKPYWDPTTTIKVCASEAQETVALGSGPSKVSCGTPEGQNAAACGCGPNLKFCYFSSVVTKIRESLREQLGRAADRVTTGKAPYTDLVLAHEAEEDGVIGFYRRNLAANAVLGLTYNVPSDDEPTENRSFLDETWRPTARNGKHAGILTMPAFLLRFQTQRSRANRFRIAFMGQYFVPAEKLEPQAGCSNDAADLTQRCNCQYCHQTLEPMSAYFGNFAEAGSALMSNRTRFPLSRPDCIGQERGECSRFYQTQADLPGPGKLLPYQFEATHPEYVANIDGGPRKLAESIIADGTFARTVVQSLLERLLKRPMKLDGADATDRPTLEALAKTFKEGGYQYPALVRSIIALPEYRSVR